MKPLSKGDPCRVRLHTGEVVEAVYDGACGRIKKFHWAYVGDKLCSVRHYTQNGYVTIVRFVGNPCVLVPVGVSV